MSRAEYLALTDDIPGELIDGHLVVAPHPHLPQLRLRTTLATALEKVLDPGYSAVHAWEWQVGPNIYIPDVLVVPDTDDDARFTGVPVLVVEMVSADRPRDLTSRLSDYAKAGLQHGWVIDLDKARTTVLRLQGAAYQRSQVGPTPTEVDFGAGRLILDVPQLLT